MSGILKLFQDFIVANGWAYLRALFTMVSEPRTALREVDLRGDAFFAFAGKFMMMNAALYVLFCLPADALAGFDYSSAPYLVSSLLMTATIWVGMVTVLHLCLHAFGGNAPYRATFVIFAMFTAFDLIGAVVMMPASRFVVPILAQPGFTEKLLSASTASDLLTTVPLSEWIYAGFAFLLGLCVVILKHALTLRTALADHGLHHWRAAGAVLLYLIALPIYLVLVVGPINNLLLIAFA